MSNKLRVVNLGMQNFSDLLRKEHFQIWVWMKGVEKNERFSMENWQYITNDERYGKVTINH